MKPILIERAVEIWKHLLRNPVFKNGDETQAGAMVAVFAVLARRCPPTEERLEQFGSVLGELLANSERRDAYMSVDYGPEGVLKQAAERSGLTADWPCKTSVWVGEDSLRVTVGYGSESQNHYQLPDGRWLVTTLSGSEINKVIKLVMEGNKDFFVEGASTAKPPAGLDFESALAAAHG